MSADEVVARARSAIGKGCHYHLGKGGFDPDDPLPFGDDYLCDCSGFAMWDLGQPRQQPDGVWEGTDEQYADAIHDTALSNGHDLFDAVPWEQGRPGDLLVWKGFGGHHGHVGVVASVGPTGPETVVHCSAGNDRRTSDAIQETGVEMFRRMGAVVARWNGLA